MTGGKRNADEPDAVTRPHKIRRLNSPAAAARDEADLFGNIDDEDLVTAYAAWEAETEAQRALEVDVVPGNVTPALLVAAFHQLHRKPADDIIKRLGIPPGTWAEDLRHLERLHNDWSGQRPITDEDTYVRLEQNLLRMEKDGLLAVVRDVAKHRVDEGTTGPEVCDTVGLSDWHTNLASEIHRYAAQKQVDAGLSVDEACRVNQVEKDQRDRVLDHAAARGAEVQQAKKWDARRLTSTGPFPIDSDDDDTLSYEPPRAAGTPQAASRFAGTAMDEKPGRWMVKAAALVRRHRTAQRTTKIGPDLTKALRERVLLFPERGEQPRTAAGTVVPGTQLSKAAFRSKVWDLGRALAAYKEKHSHARNGAPYLDVIGIRDDTMPRSPGSMKHQQIDVLLDEIVPPNTGYNAIRQNIVDLVLDSPAAAVAAPLSSQDRLCDSESAVADRLVLDLHKGRGFQFNSPFNTSGAMRTGFEPALNKIASSTPLGGFVSSLSRSEIKLKASARIDAFFNMTDRVSSEIRRVPARATQKEHDADGSRATRVVAMARANVAYLASELIPDQDGCVIHRRALIDLVASRRHEWADPATPELHEMEAMFLPKDHEHEIRHEPDAPYKFVMQTAWQAEQRLRQQSHVDLPRQEAKLRALVLGIDTYMRAIASREASGVADRAEHQTQGQNPDRADRRAAADRVRTRRFGR